MKNVKVLIGTTAAVKSEAGAEFRHPGRRPGDRTSFWTWIW